jgi:hypothetical protein
VRASIDQQASSLINICVIERKLRHFAASSCNLCAIICIRFSTALILRKSYSQISRAARIMASFWLAYLTTISLRKTLEPRQCNKTKTVFSV